MWNIFGLTDITFSSNLSIHFCKQLLEAASVVLLFTVILIESSTVFAPLSDNYGFVTYKNRDEAYCAVEHGNDDPKLPRYDLCFGGRRAFCKVSYSDLGEAIFDNYGGDIMLKMKLQGKIVVCELAKTRNTSIRYSSANNLPEIIVILLLKNLASGMNSNVNKPYNYRV